MFYWKIGVNIFINLTLLLVLYILLFPDNLKRRGVISLKRIQKKIQKKMFKFQKEIQAVYIASSSSYVYYLYLRNEKKEVIIINILSLLFLYLVTIEIKFNYLFQLVVNILLLILNFKIQQVFFEYINIIIEMFLVLIFIRSVNVYHSKLKTKRKTLIKDDYLFIDKKEKLSELKKVIDNKNISTVIINQKIGGGKTYFIDSFIKKTSWNNNLEIIYIKLPFFNDVTEIKLALLNEMNKIFKKNFIHTTFLKNILNYISSVKAKNVEIVLKPTSNQTFWDSLIEMKKKLNILMEKKNLIIVIDDIERCTDEKFVRESIFFLGEFSEFFRETKATILFLADKEEINEILKKDNMKLSFLEKYFSYELSLGHTGIHNSNKFIDELLTELNLESEKSWIESMFKIWEILIEKVEQIVIDLDKKKEKKELEKEELEAHEIDAIQLKEKEIQELLKNRLEFINFKEAVLKRNNIRNIKKFLHNISNKKYKEKYKINIILYNLSYFFEIFYCINVDNLSSEKLKAIILSDDEFEISSEKLYYFCIQEVLKMFSCLNPYKVENDEAYNKAITFIRVKKYNISYEEIELTDIDKLFYYVFGKNSLLKVTKEFEWKSLFPLFKDTDRFSKILDLDIFLKNENLDEEVFDFFTEILSKQHINENSLKKLLDFLLKKYKLGEHYKLIFISFDYPNDEVDEIDEQRIFNRRVSLKLFESRLLKEIKKINPTLINHEYILKLNELSNNDKLAIEYEWI